MFRCGVNTYVSRTFVNAECAEAHQLNLVALYKRRDDFAHDLSTSHYRRTYSDSTILVYEEDLVEFYYCATLCTLDVVNEEATALFYVELLALNVYDDVHYR